MHIKHNKYTKVILFPFIYFAELYGYYFPKSYMKIRYFARFGKIINLRNPQNLNEKIQWLLFNTNTSKWSRLADKYAVRDYVSECGLEDNLLQLYGKWNNANDIDFELLPKSFVLKTNHGCGTIIIVNDKSKIDEKSIRKKMNKWLNSKRDMGSEIHYKNIEPCIIAEELLPIEDGVSSITDYKIWCFNGKPHNFLITSNRFKGGVHLGCYDLQWNYQPNNLIITKSHPQENKPFKKPDNLDEILKVAEKLAGNFPQVRVDLYNIKGEIYFGEMTFTSKGGLMNYYTPEFLLEMGNQIKL